MNRLFSVRLRRRQLAEVGQWRRRVERLRKRNERAFRNVRRLEQLGTLGMFVLLGGLLAQFVTREERRRG